jgi:hypothetical protein
MSIGTPDIASFEYLLYPYHLTRAAIESEILRNCIAGMV